MIRRFALAVSLLLPVVALCDDGNVLYPVNAMSMLCRGPAGDEHVMIRSVMDANYLQEACGEWEGKIRGRNALLVSSTLKTPDEGMRYEFAAGILSGVFSNGVRLATQPKDAVGTLDSLYPPETSVAAERASEDPFDVWEKSGRLRLWWRNPNKTGAFLVTVLLLFAWFAQRGKGRIRIVCACSGLIVAVLVFLTGSRGAFVAALAGGALLFLPCCHLKTSWRRACIVFGAVAMLVGVVMYFHLADHYTWKLFETKNANALRVDMLKAFPKMIAAAPDGWGSGNAGTSYVTWYRDPEITQVARTLLNSHMTFLAEHGNVMRFAYLTLWLFAIVCFGWQAFSRKETLTLAETAALGIAAMFNPVLEDVACWVIPAGAAVVSVVCLSRLRAKFILIGLTVSALTAVGLLFGLTTLGSRGHELPSLARIGNVMHLQGKEPHTWVAGDEFVLGGWDFIGNEFRIYYERNPDAPALAYVESVDDLPPQVERLVLAGRSAEKYVKRWRESGGKGVCQAKALLFLSPSVLVTDIPEDLLAQSRVRGVVGSLAARHAICYEENLPKWTRLAPGVLLYVPNWIQLAFDF